MRASNKGKQCTCEKLKKRLDLLEQIQDKHLEWIKMHETILTKMRFTDHYVEEQG